MPPSALPFFERAGWLDDLTNWLREAIAAVVKAILQFFLDLLILFIEKLLQLFALIINAIPAPEFLQGVTIGGILASAGPTVGWLITEFHLVDCFNLISAAYAFRFARKLATFGLW